MLKYNNTIEEDLQIMQNYDISAEQLFLVKLLFVAQEDNGRQGAIVDYFVKCRHSSIPLEMLQSLAEKNILTKESIPKKGDKFIADNLHFQKKFLNDWFVYAHEAGKELMDKYPNYMKTVGGELLPAKNITKVYISLEAMFNAYGKSIRHSRNNHVKVMHLLAWAEERNLIKFGIAEFVASKKWESLEQDYIQTTEGVFEQNYDNKTVV